MPSEMSRIRLLAPTETDAVVSTLVDVVNGVYADAEKGLWLEGASRTNAEEMAEHIRAGQIAVATSGDRILGCVRLQRLDDRTGEFGMLAVDPGHRSAGLGRELVRFAEQHFQADGHDTMRLELLVPREWSHPTKEFLARWYTRIGYSVVRTETIEKSYPDLAPLLATPCDFVIYHKALRKDAF